MSENKTNGKSAVVTSAKKGSKQKKESQRVASQDIILQVLKGKAKMELEELAKECQKVHPKKSSDTYLSIARHEFKVETDKDGKTFVYPEISEQGLAFSAKYVGSKGISHWTARKFPKEVLAAGRKSLKANEIATLEKVLAEEKEAEKKS